MQSKHSAYPGIVIEIVMYFQLPNVKDASTVLSAHQKPLIDNKTCKRHGTERVPEAVVEHLRVLGRELILEVELAAVKGDRLH